MNATTKFIYSIFIAAALLMSQSVQAQSSNYITHIIKSGETLSALAKHYGTSVGDIMRLNGMTTTSKLQIGEAVKIPVQGKKIVADTTAASTTVTHTVQKGETLYSIARKYKVTISDLKSLNHLAAGTLKIGQKLIIKTSSSVVTNTSLTAQNNPQTSQPTQDSTPAQIINKISGDTSVANVPIENTAVNKPQPAPQSQSEPVINAAAINPEGYFSTMFGLDVQSKTLQTVNGTSMTFKTASGWTDKKYYILMNDVPTGSIVRVTAADGKTIYAKVLWNMSDIKENDGLDFRISTAAAAALGLSDEKFPLTITYYK